MDDQDDWPAGPGHGARDGSDVVGEADAAARRIGGTETGEGESLHLVAGIAQRAFDLFPGPAAEPEAGDEDKGGRSPGTALHIPSIGRGTGRGRRPAPGGRLGR